jgi:MinD superfamily P-loop ATPase
MGLLCCGGKMKIAVLSGKGGTGKTSLTAAIARCISDVTLVDCDVDAANLHLLFDVQIEDRGCFHGSHEAIKDPALCTQCGRCRDACRFEAIGEDLAIDPYLCEGCGACVSVCPESALSLTVRSTGEWYVGDAPAGPIAGAELFPGEEASGKLVTVVKQKGDELAAERGFTKRVLDGAPGIGCPVIATLNDVDVAVLVTEPSVSGLHDLKRILGVVQHFGVRSYLVVNKADLSPALAESIASFAKRQELPLLGEIPYDPQVPLLMIRGRLPVDDPESSAGQAMRGICDRLIAKEGL